MITKEDLETLKIGDIVYYEYEGSDDCVWLLACCKIVSDEDCFIARNRFREHVVSVNFLIRELAIFGSLNDWHLTAEEGFKAIEGAK